MSAGPPTCAGSGLAQDGIGDRLPQPRIAGRHLSRSGKSKTAESALEQALIARFGTPGWVPAPLVLRSDNGLVFTGCSFTALARSYGLRQEFITPHSPEQNGLVERVIRTFKEIASGSPPSFSSLRFTA